MCCELVWKVQYSLVQDALHVFASGYRKQIGFLSQGGRHFGIPQKARQQLTDAVPTDMTTYSFLFDNPGRYFPSRDASGPPMGYTNTATLFRLTHSEIQSVAASISASLTTEHGLRPGDVVSTCSSNAVSHPAAVFGVMRAGGIPALSSPAFNEEEMIHVSRTVICKSVLCEQANTKVVRGALRQLKRRGECVLVMDGKREDEVRAAISADYLRFNNTDERIARHRGRCPRERRIAKSALCCDSVVARPDSQTPWALLQFHLSSIHI